MIMLDTQVWLWWLHDPGRLSKRAAKAVRQAEKSDGMMVSTISVWEVATKQALGKLRLPMEIHEWFGAAVTYPGIVLEPLSPLDAIDSTLLPGDFHKDPADRIIVAMARRQGLPLVTSDLLIRAYGQVETIW
jgi:PIN domain nuclease of toxin-antitoxin system